MGKIVYKTNCKFGIDLDTFFNAVHSSSGSRKKQAHLGLKISLHSCETGEGRHSQEELTNKEITEERITGLVEDHHH